MNRLSPIDSLYVEAWRQLAAERLSIPEIEREGTPVLVFGRWQTSRVATAGLNPSEAEFRDRRGLPLTGDRQRFLHWPADGRLTEKRLRLAALRAERYFTLGNAYKRWFDLYAAFLGGLGVAFADGSACHTDYVSPFATGTGIGACRPQVRQRLSAYGHALWARIISAIPHLQIIFGHGAGWQAMPRLLDFAGWQPLPTEFDRKGGRYRAQRPYVLFARVALPGRPQAIGLYWWRPNRGAPLTWLNAHERAGLGALIRAHAAEQGLWAT